MLRPVAAVLVTAILTMLASLPVAAGSPVDCGSGYFNGHTCTVKATSPGTPPAPSGDAVATVRECTYAGKRIPCGSQMGWWSAAKSCYVRLSAAQPPKSDPVWQGNSDGAIYDCSLPGAGSYTSFPFWAASAPAGPDPRVLAQQAVDSMNLQPISIGIVPEDAPGAVGLVGLPTWLWVEDPGPQSWGPITRSASAGGVTVTATAEVGSVRWLMGDGGVVTCTGPGTPYQDGFGTSESPTCGYRYADQGTYRVQAESSWLVRWSGMGESGTIPLTTTATTQVTIGELQVLTQGEG